MSNAGWSEVIAVLVKESLEIETIIGLCRTVQISGRGIELLVSINVRNIFLTANQADPEQHRAAYLHVGAKK